MNASELRDAVVAALAGVADQLPEAPPGQRIDPGDRLDIRAHHVAGAAGCPAAVALEEPTPFVPSASMAGWAAAATVTDRLVHGHPDPQRGSPPADPGAGFRTAWAEGERLEGWPWDWLHQPGTTAADRALTAADVQRRISGLARVLAPWPGATAPCLGLASPGSGGRRPQTCQPLAGASHVGHQPRWAFPGRPLRLVGRVDVVLGKRDGSHRLAVVLNGDHGPATRARLAYEALVEALVLRRAPAEVLGLLPDAGRRWPLTVDDALLAEGVAVAALAARIALGASRRDASGLARRPGPRCRYCPAAVGCAEGETWLAGPGRLRSGFLPAPA